MEIEMTAARPLTVGGKHIEQDATVGKIDTGDMTLQQFLEAARNGKIKPKDNPEGKSNKKQAVSDGKKNKDENG